MASEKNKTNSYKRKKDGSPIKTIPQNQAEQSYCNETTANTPTKQSQQGILSGKKWSECKKTDKIMTIATIFIAAFTLILLTIIYFQYSAFVDAAHVENRAYLVLACEIDTPIIGKPPHARWEVKNIGKTPAYKVRHPNVFGLAGLNKDFWIPAIDRQTPDIGNIIGDATIKNDVR